MARSFSEIKPSKHIKNKRVMSKYSKRLAIELASLDRQSRLSPQRAKKLFRIIESGIGNVRRAVFLFHLGCGSEIVSKKLPKGSCYLEHLRLARIERNIKPFGVIGETDEDLLMEILRLGKPTEQVASRLQRLCWSTVKKVAEADHQRITLDLVKKVVDEFIDLYSNKRVIVI